jgi:hypothetical protein
MRTKADVVPAKAGTAGPARPAVAAFMGTTNFLQVKHAIILVMP